MNAVVLAVVVMLVLSLARLNVIIALFVGALAGGVSSPLGLTETIAAFTSGISNGASIALSYATLGAFAVGIAKSGIPAYTAAKIVTLVQHSRQDYRLLKLVILVAVILMAVASQNLIPVHIAFIPVLIPPLLNLFNALQLDRRLIACGLTFGLTGTYMLLPVGFGNLFLTEILAKNLLDNGLQIDSTLMPLAMLIPVSGMFLGLLIATFWSYRAPRTYRNDLEESAPKKSAGNMQLSGKTVAGTITAMALALGAQLGSGSMMTGALVGCIALLATGVLHWRESNTVFIDGIKMMAYAGFIMITAAGFAEVLRQSGEISSLVSSASDLFGNNQGMAIALMLLSGLLITMGIGSSFSTVPVIATLFVPLGIELGLSPLGIAALVGTAGALGDAGSPASDSTIGPTAGLNADGQHDHIRGSVIPTFIHFNIPLLIFGWIAAMAL